MNDWSALVGRGERVMARVPAGLIRFLCVGMMGLATQLATFDALHRLSLGKSLAWFAGFALATLVTWQLNRRLTFAATGRRRRTEMARYVLVTGVAQGVSFLIFSSLIAAEPWLRPAFPLGLRLMLANVWPDAALIAGAVIATLFSYTGQRFFTFAPPKDEVASVVTEAPLA